MQPGWQRCFKWQQHTFSLVRSRSTFWHFLNSVSEGFRSFVSPSCYHSHCSIIGKRRSQWKLDYILMITRNQNMKINRFLASTTELLYWIKNKNKKSHLPSMVSGLYIGCPWARDLNAQYVNSAMQNNTTKQAVWSRIRGDVVTKVCLKRLRNRCQQTM